jgi:hypothetical protein
MLNVWLLPVELLSVNVNVVGLLFEALTLPKLAESGSNQTVAFAALVRFSLGRRTHVVRASLGILDHQIGAVDEGRFNLRGRPARMEIQQHGRRARDVRGRHRG